MVFALTFYNYFKSQVLASSITKAKHLKQMPYFNFTTFVKICIYLGHRIMSLSLTTRQKSIKWLSGLYGPIPLEAITRLNGRYLCVLLALPWIHVISHLMKSFSFPSSTALSGFTDVILKIISHDNLSPSYVFQLNIYILWLLKDVMFWQNLPRNRKKSEKLFPMRCEGKGWLGMDMQELSEVMVMLSW